MLKMIADHPIFLCEAALTASAMIMIATILCQATILPATILPTPKTNILDLMKFTVNPTEHNNAVHSYNKANDHDSKSLSSKCAHRFNSYVDFHSSDESYIDDPISHSTTKHPLDILDNGGVETK